VRVWCRVGYSEDGGVGRIVCLAFPPFPFPLSGGPCPALCRPRVFPPPYPLSSCAGFASVPCSVYLFVSSCSASFTLFLCPTTLAFCPPVALFFFFVCHSLPHASVVARPFLWSPPLFTRPIPPPLPAPYTFFPLYCTRRRSWAPRFFFAAALQSAVTCLPWRRLGTIRARHASTAPPHPPPVRQRAGKRRADAGRHDCRPPAGTKAIRRRGWRGAARPPGWEALGLSRDTAEGDTRRPIHIDR